MQFYRLIPRKKSQTKEARLKKRALFIIIILPLIPGYDINTHHKFWMFNEQKVRQSD